jgi:5-carboxymethyl-2-hydroxymuconate isomerase
MPHLTLEYTKNLNTLDARRALFELNQVLVKSGHFKEPDLKSRAIPLETFLVGTSPEERAFVHLKLSILSGRTAQDKQELSGQLLQALRRICAGDIGCHLQLCVEILEMDRGSYVKEAVVR